MLLSHTGKRCREDVHCEQICFRHLLGARDTYSWVSGTGAHDINTRVYVTILFDILSGCLGAVFLRASCWCGWLLGACACVCGVCMCGVCVCMYKELD